MKIYLALIIMSIISNTYAIRNGDSVNNERIARLYLSGRTCTAVRISTRYFLTAAHCITTNRSDDFTIYFIDEGEIIREVINNNEVIINKTNYDEELAIIEVKSQNLSAAVVSIFKDNLNPMHKFSILGYGFDKSDSRVLKIGEHEFYKYEQGLNKPMIVSRPGLDNHNPCPGDSGGGLFLKGTNKLVGLISYIEHDKLNLYTIAKKKSRESYSFDSSHYYCKKANMAFSISLKDNLDFLKDFIN